MLSIEGLLMPEKVGAAPIQAALGTLLDGLEVHRSRTTDQGRASEALGKIKRDIPVPRIERHGAQLAWLGRLKNRVEMGF